MDDADATRSEPMDARPSSSHRPRRLLIAAFVAVAVIGGLVGGSVVALVNGSGSSGGALGDNTRATCAATAVAEKVLPSVVTILTSSNEGGGNGSGQIIRSGGYILTNDHVIAAAYDGGQVSVLYSDGTTSPATIVGRDPATDLAVVKAADEAQGRPLIPIGSSGALRVGQPVVALGAPLGLYGTVTAGIVSALDRYFPGPAETGGQEAHFIDAIQTDASINPGNSGGALVDCAGRLVGVNSVIATVPNSAGQSGGGSVGLGFAIPVDLAIPLAEELIATGRVNHPAFGLRAQPIPAFAAEELGVAAGLFVTEVDPGGPADQAGVARGDVITEVEGQQATGLAVLVKETLTRQAGDAVAITYVRDGTSVTTNVMLGSGP